eukprot:TRINITY_DN2970_c3_g1_i6.p1 TRINITY_DN2970_c3_g1~~TRINITY_DN2970_c3_g1_i6.p1  ORF type:complete len:194 (+),score=3.66 TRINITY_DN2970_c3_g1_i6:171-752(+)
MPKLSEELLEGPEPSRAAEALTDLPARETRQAGDERDTAVASVNTSAVMGERSHAARGPLRDSHTCDAVEVSSARLRHEHATPCLPALARSFEEQRLATAQSEAFPARSEQGRIRWRTGDGSLAPLSVLRSTPLRTALAERMEDYSHLQGRRDLSSRRQPQQSKAPLCEAPAIACLLFGRTPIVLCWGFVMCV